MNILVTGKAKTGTTVISKCIASSVANCAYHLEPKHPAYFLCGKFDRSRDNVVKLIFEHWNDRPRSRNALLHGELDVVFDKLVFIIRDPRDELISRLLYFIYPWTAQNGLDEQRLEAWLQALQEKERAPSTVAFVDLVDSLHRIYGSQVLAAFDSRAYMAQVNTAPNNSHVLRYEAFMCGRTEALESYLGFPLSASRDIGELTRTRRSGAWDNWKQVFTERDVQYFKQHCGDLVELIAQLGYTDWELDTPQQLDGRIYSGYVRELASRMPPKSPGWLRWLR